MQTQEETQPINPYETPKAASQLPPANKGAYNGKVYSLIGISLGTLFGSVLAAGLMLQSNFAHFRQTLHASITVIITILTTITYLFLGLITEHPSALLYLGFNFLLALIILPITYWLQGQQLDKHEEASLPFHSVARSLIFGVACLIAMGAMLFFSFNMFLYIQ